MAAEVVGDAEVDEREPLRRAPLDLVERLEPAVAVELGRRRGREDELARLDAHAGRVARVERPLAVEEADVVPRVARRREAVEAEHAVADDADVLLGHRRELAPELVEVLAVESARALLEPRRVDEVGRADLRDVDGQPGCSRTRTPAAPAWSRWMCDSSRWRRSVSARPCSASRSFSVGTVVVGPQSKSAEPVGRVEQVRRR